MNVSVDDDGFFNVAVRLQTANGYGDVVYRAKTFTVIGVSMMKASREIAGEAIAERELSSQDGATRGEPDGFGEVGRVWNFEFDGIACGERSGLQFGDPLRSVNAEKIVVGRPAGFEAVARCGSFVVGEEVVAK